MKYYVFSALIYLMVMTSVAQNYAYRFDWGTKGTATSQMMNAQSVAVDKDGAVFIMDMVNEKVKKFDSLGVYQSSFAISREAFDLAIDANGDIIVSSFYELAKYSSTGQKLLVFDQGNFKDVDIDENGNIIAFDKGVNYVKKFSPQGIQTGYWAWTQTDGNTIPFVYGSTLGDDGNVYINGYPNALYKYDESGNELGMWPFGEVIDRIVADKNGNILAFTRDDDINVYSTDGTFLYTIGNAGTGDAEFDAPLDAAFGKSGFMWVLDRYNNRIQGFEYCPNTPDKPDGIVGNNTLCESTAGEVYSISPVQDAIGYEWKVPVGWTITSGQGTTQITVDISKEAESDSITVAAYNDCGLGRKRSLIVELVAAPEITMQDKYLCAGDASIFEGSEGHSIYLLEGPNNLTWNTRTTSVSEYGKYKLTITGNTGCVHSDSAEVFEKTTDCDNINDYPWQWAGHRNWFLGTNVYTAQIVDMETGGITDVGVSGVTRVHNYEGVTSVSNDNGELLFYSSGKQIFTGTGSSTKVAFETLRPNNSGALFSSISAVQGIITVRHPDTPDEYFVFITDEDLAPTIGLNYSIFNSKAENLAPFGSNRIGTYKTTEGIAATSHGNGKDIWIAVQGATTGAFYNYLLTEDGLDTVPVISYVAPYQNNGQFGALAFSYDGAKFASVGATTQMDRNISLYDFDNVTGIISNYKPIGDDEDWMYSPYDVVFSPNGEGLIVSSRKNGMPDAVSHFDLSNWSNPSIIAASKTSFPIGGAALEYAADGFLYTTLQIDFDVNKRTLGRIKGDYNSGSNLTVEKWEGTLGSWGLPSMYLPPSNVINSVNRLNTLDGKVYPNPMSDKLYFDLKQGIYNIKLTNLAGVVLFNGHEKVGFALDVSGFASGTYLLSISNENGSLVRKVVKQ